MNEYKDIKKNNPEFVKYVENKYKKNLITILIIWSSSSALILITYFLYKPALQNLSYINLTLGSYFWAIGSLKTPRSIIPLSMSRFDYSKPLANEFLRTSKEVSIGIWLILSSIVIQIWLIK